MNATGRRLHKCTYPFRELAGRQNDALTGRIDGSFALDIPREGVGVPSGPFERLGGIVEDVEGSLVIVPSQLGREAGIRGGLEFPESVDTVFGSFGCTE